MKYFLKESERKGTCYHEFQKGKWEAIYNKSRLIGGETKLAIEELGIWVKHNFQTEYVFTRLGL